MNRSRTYLTPNRHEKYMVVDGYNIINAWESLKKFINDKGKILPRRATGACAKHQRDITIAVKRARQIALLPFVAE